MTDEVLRQQRQTMMRKDSKSYQPIEGSYHIAELSKKRTCKYNKSVIQADEVQGWIPKNKTVNIAGRLVRGLVYVGQPPQVETVGGDVQYCNAYIDPTLSFNFGSAESPRTGNSLYFTYSSLKPNIRGKYLDWLATGKKSDFFELEFIQIYFLGLERRLLVDKPTFIEANYILAELDKLKRYFGQYNLSYIDDLLEYYHITTDAAPYLAKFLDHRVVTNPLIFHIDGSIKILNKESLNYQHFYCLLTQYCEKEITEIRDRRPIDFEVLFEQEFKRQFPAGVKCVLTDNYMDRDYKSISNEFECTGLLICNGNYLPRYSNSEFFERSILPSATKVAKQLIEEKGFTKQIRKSSPQSNSSSHDYSWLANPNYELEKQEVIEWKNDLLTRKSKMSVYDVLKFTGTVEPMAFYAKPQWDRAIRKLVDAGFGLVPELTLFLNYNDFDAAVFVNELDCAKSEWNSCSKQYLSILVSLALGHLIFRNDGLLTSSQKVVLEDLINKTTRLTPVEIKRLQLNFQRMLKVPPFPKFVDRIYIFQKMINPNFVRQFLLKCTSMANLNNVKTISLLESAYKKLKISTELLYSDLHGLELKSNFSKSQKRQTKSYELDFVRINEIRDETKQVSEALGDIFSEQQQSKIEKSNFSDYQNIGLDFKHETLVQNLIKKSSWTSSEFECLVKQQGLFPDGALESINEWAFERYEAQLIDDYEGYVVNADIVVKLTLELDGKKLAA